MAVDYLFNQLVENILENGVWQQPEDVRAKWDDGTPAVAKSLTDIQWKFDVGNTALIPTTKDFANKFALRELWWIWIMKSNKVQDLRDMNKDNKSIWDKWEIPEGTWKGTIGPAYGYQLAQRIMKWKVKDIDKNHIDKTPDKYKFLGPDDVGHDDEYVYLDQVDHLIQSLLKGPGSRRLITTLWVPSDIDKMSLTPCVWNTQWLRWNGRLNLTVAIRSNDICVGNPFNIYQYQILQHMMAQIVNIPVGTLTFNITDAHIYDRHISLVRKQIKEEIQDAPKITLNPEIKNFYDFKIEDIILDKKLPARKYEYPVSI